MFPIRPLTPLALRAVLVALALSFALPARAQTIDTSLWVPNGVVNALVRDGNTLYLGGQFTRVAPPTGGWILADAAIGALTAARPRFAGVVYATASDGAGGWYVGGHFDYVGGVARRNLAHVLADGSVDAWKPDPNHAVRALARSGSLLFCGGDFDSIASGHHPALACFNTVTLALTAFDAAPNGAVAALAVSGGSVYAGGGFSSIGGAARSGAAALDVTTGGASGWNPSPNSYVSALAISGSTVYLGGAFSAIGLTSRNGLAAVDATTGVLSAWNPAPTSGTSGLNINAILPMGGLVAVGGLFAGIGGGSRLNLATVSASTGLVSGPSMNANGVVYALAAHGDTLVVAGEFATVAAAERPAAAAIDVTTGAVLAWNPAPSQAAYAAACAGGVVALGGAFTGAGGVERARVAAIDLTTRQATAWNPHVGGVSVNALQLGSGVLYVAGQFDTAGTNRVLRRNAAALRLATGTATAWDPRPNGSVAALASDGATVWLGGDFTAVGPSTPRSMLAAVDTASGTAKSWRADAYGGGLYCLAYDAGRLYVGGYLTNVGGLARTNAAALDATTAAVLAWDPQPNSFLLAIAPTATGIYLAGGFSTVGGASRARLASVSVSTGAALAWSPTFGTTATALLVGTSRVYAGTNSPSYGASPAGIGAYEMSTGNLDAWSPDIRTTGSANAHVLALARDAGHVYAGGWFGAAQGQPTPYLASFTTSEPPVLGQAWLVRPAQMLLTTGMSYPAVFGHVRIDGVTGAAGPAAGVTMQAGWGPVGSDPASEAGWTWSTGTYDADVNGNDEYFAPIGPAPAGAYDYCVRFSYLGGAWVYGDLVNGSGDGYASASAGKLTVSTQPTVTWCNTQWPPSLTAPVNTPSSTVYGQVWIEGDTNAPGAAGDLTVDLGWGPLGSDPATSAAWHWNTAAYNTDVGNNDEYMGTLTANWAGMYEYAFRYRRGAGPWAYGDLDGTDNGYSPLTAGILTVTGTTDAEGARPTRLDLALANGNPSRGEAALVLALPTEARVRVALYDLAGRRVATLAEGVRAAGWHPLAFRPAGNAAGVYFARLEASGRTITRRLVILE